MIVGAGFGGLNAAQALASAPVSITVIDRRNHHTFQPLLYQVATAGLSPGEIAAPIRSILSRHKNVEVLMAEVTGFDLERRVVQTLATTQELRKFLTITSSSPPAPATPISATTNGRLSRPASRPSRTRSKSAAAFCWPSNSPSGSAAAGEPCDPLNFVVVGGGPTGVELAGTLAEICRHALAQISAPSIRAAPAFI